jgi:hypothetical protein
MDPTSDIHKPDNLPSFEEFKDHFMGQLTLDQKKAMKSAFLDANLEIAIELFRMMGSRNDGTECIRICAIADTINKILDIITNDIKESCTDS